MRAFNNRKPRKFKFSIIVLAVNVLATLLYGQGQDAQLLDDAKTTFGTVSAPMPEELEKPIVELGRHLFWDERLHVRSCNSLHK